MTKETSEIAKLTERISKDPKSKLFVPLAEEYKKTGEIEMAIYVLTEGLKNNPGYVTARSILGKLLLEKGELEASQKEFEEVVKAIPDNLVAQRKLGELYAFQNRPDEAVKHLKIVFSANPRDAELASLVSDLEAGRDVRQRIHLPKPQLSPGKSAGKGVQAAPSPQAAARPIPARPAVAPAAPVAPKTAAVKETQAPKGLAAQTGQKAAGRTAPPVAVTQAAPKAEQAEEPEDIMTIEPLEPVTEIPEAAISEIVAPETAAPEMAAPAPDFLAEEDHAASAAPLEEPFAEMAPSPSVEQAPEASPEAESFFAEASPVLELEEKETLPGPAEVVAESDIIGAEVVEEALEAVAAAEAPAESAEKSDDFTTDTLAELYISQGFYEKAIDIYERMLADKPTSAGLKNKLAKVREMAAESGPAAAPAAFAEAATEPAEAGLDVFAGQADFAPPAASEEGILDAEVLVEPNEAPSGREPAAKGKEKDIFAGLVEEAPAAGRRKTADTGREPSFDVFDMTPAGSGAEAKPLFTDFEPREYVPPKDEFEPAEQKVEAAPAVSMSSKAARRETIDRLETWLKNIKKEK